MMDESGKRYLPIEEDKKTGKPIWIDARELKLRYRIPISGVERFFEALKDGKLLATKCKRCGEKYFPPQACCPNCRSSDMEWIEVNGYGRLLTYTVVKVKPESYQKYPDYILGVARLDDGFNILAWILCEDFKRLRRGMRVKIDFKKKAGENYMSYFIVPVED